MKNLFYYSVMMLIASCSASSYKSNSDVIHPSDLRCEYLKNPLGIDVTNPRFYWKLKSDQRSQIQTAYQVIASSTKEKLQANEGDLWDSKKIQSSESIHVKYAGKTLTSGQQCFWKVKVWDKNDKESEWSEAATFSMGLLQKTDWKAKWIGLDKAVGNDKPKQEKTILSARYLRKEFDAASEIKRATVYICGQGCSELYLNGKKTGDAVLSPALSEYRVRSYYVTYEVASQLVKGKNAVGVALGNGRFFNMRAKEPFTMQGYGYPKLLFQLVIEYTDGKSEIIISDETWKLTADGPITANSEYDGEHYDARKEMPGWNNVGFNDEKWMNPELVKPASPQLCAQMNNPIRIMQQIKPVKIIKKKNSFIYDMGQNMVGWVKLSVKAPKGTEIKMHFAETLTKDSDLFIANLRSAETTNTYITKGEDNEEWMPCFTYHGFRFMEISGFPGTPELNNIEGQVVYDDVELNGTFECSNDVINNIYKNCYWGIRGNYRSMPTDCPQRDERMGWLGDRATGSKGESFIFDVAAFHSKWLRDIGDAQNQAGSIPDVAPTYWEIYSDNVTWAGTYVILTDMLYRQYGDKENIARHYESMKKWINYMKSKYLRNDLLFKDTYGDWCTPPENLTLINTSNPNRITSGELISTTYFCLVNTMMKRFADILGKPEDAKMFEATAEQMKSGLNRHYLNKSKNTYSNNSLTSNLLPLAFKMVPKEYEQKIFENTLYKVFSEANGHISCGLVGCQWINRIMSDYGRPDVAYMLASNTTYPSWGYMITQGATTIWELWNGNTADPGMNSGNHVMLIGDLVIWMYEYLGAIQSDIDNPGFKHINMKPALIKDMKWVNATHTSLYGEIKSSWKQDDGKFIWNISIPANSFATISIPAKNESDVSEGNTKAVNAVGLKFIEVKNGYAVFEAGSGDYHFVSESFEIPSDLKTFVSSPVISPIDTIAAAPAKIKIVLKCSTEGAQIRYTTDGTEPTKDSKLYTEPFEIDSYCYVSTKAFKEGSVESQAAYCQYDIYNPEKNGWNYSYYEGKWNKLPDFSKLTPKKKGETISMNVSKLKNREDYFGLVFTGKINIAAEGEYTFFVNSDDGSRIAIDGNTIVLNDSIHSMTERHEAVKLSKGMHDIRVEFFDGNFNEGLFVNIQGPGLLNQRLPLAMIFKK